MISEDEINKILERYYNRYNKFNTEVLIKLGETIKAFEDIKPSQAHQLAQELKYNFTVEQLIEELNRITGISIKDLYDTFDEVARKNTEFSEVYYKAKDLDYVLYKENGELQRYVRALADQNVDMINIANSRNIGFTMYNNETKKYVFIGLRDTYNNLIDQAVNLVSTGVIDYQSAMRNTINQLASSGVKVRQATVGYGNYNKRLDSTIRQNILDAVRDINQNMQDRIGDEIGANGVEISAHECCALDHLDYQGKQFSDEEYKELQSILSRPIGYWNCRHFTNRIILGIDQPLYTKDQINYYRKNSLQKIDYEGKTYTRYEATQVQRSLETETKKNKDKQIMARASGNEELAMKYQNKINQLTTKYANFSKVAGLDTYKQRLSVSGYRKIKVK